jgi:hypothetical protein
VNSQKLVCGMPHSPARWPPYGRPESSRFLKVDHYMLHVRIMMRLGGCASLRQDTDYAGAGVVRSSGGGPISEVRLVLTWMWVQAVLEAAIYGQGRKSSRSRSSATKLFEEALTEP